MYGTVPSLRKYLTGLTKSGRQDSPVGHTKSLIIVTHSLVYNFIKHQARIPAVYLFGSWFYMVEQYLTKV